VIVIDVVVLLAPQDGDVLLPLVAALAIILLVRTNAGIVTETMTVRVDVTGTVPVALTIVIASVILRMIVRTVTAGRTVLMGMTESLSTVLLPLMRTSMSLSRRPFCCAFSTRKTSWACQAQAKVSTFWLRLASFPGT